ncbi:hypothetical protein B0J14DRAFT_341839 [Halenospora varia]|nr:hypothetical protein B0J14DRAFT_341839 [Halenospora varia]
MKLARRFVVWGCCVTSVRGRLRSVAANRCPEMVVYQDASGLNLQSSKSKEQQASGSCSVQIQLFSNEDAFVKYILLSIVTSQRLNGLTMEERDGTRRKSLGRRVGS